jgi:hypothetical protein
VKAPTFETNEGAFTPVKWGPAPNAELCAHIADPDGRGADQIARPEFVRFLALADVRLDEVYPPASRLTHSNLRGRIGLAAVPEGYARLAHRPLASSG